VFAIYQNLNTLILSYFRVIQDINGADLASNSNRAWIVAALECVVQNQNFLPYCEHLTSSSTDKCCYLAYIFLIAPVPPTK